MGKMVKSAGLCSRWNCSLHQLVLVDLFYSSLKNKLVLVQADINK